MTQPRGGRERGGPGRLSGIPATGFPGKDASRAQAQTREGPDFLSFQQVARVPALNLAQRFRHSPAAHGNEKTGRVWSSE